MIRRPPRSTQSRSSAASDVYKRQALVKDYAPELLAVHGVGPDVAAALLTVTGENVDRITSESALAHLCGAAPIPASSGKTNRNRLNRGETAKATPPYTASLSAG